MHKRGTVSLESLAQAGGRLLGTGAGFFQHNHHSNGRQFSSNDNSMEQLLPDYPVPPIDRLTAYLAKQFALIAPSLRGFKSPERVGAVLSGATKRAWFQIGALKFIDDYRIVLQALTAVSSGAMVAAGYESFRQEYESNPQTFSGFRGPAHKLEHFVRQWGNLTPPYGPLDFALHEGVVNTASLEGFLSAITGEKTFWDLQRIRVIVYSLSTGTNIVYGITDKDSKIKDATRKSVAYPGFIETVKRENEVHADGGILRKIPLRESYKFDPDLSLRIAIYVGGPPEPNDASIIPQIYNGNGHSQISEVLYLLPRYVTRVKQSLSADGELLHLGISSREWQDYNHDVVELTGQELKAVEKGNHTGLVAIRTERGFIPKLSEIDEAALSDEGYRAAYNSFQIYFGMLPQQVAYLRSQYGLELREIRALSQLRNWIGQAFIKSSDFTHSPWIPH